MSKIIVGVDASEGASDAISLASGLAGITGAQLVLVNVFPYDRHPSRAVNTAFEHYLRQDSTELLERLRSGLGDDTVEIRAVPNTSSAHGLHALAEREDADLIVVGSTHTGRAGRVLPGSTAERLLHGAPCPVAVAPKGYAQDPVRAPKTIGCAFDGSLSSQGALEAARGIAEATGARLRVIRAFRPTSPAVPPKGVPMGGIAAFNDELRDHAAEELRAAVARLGLPDAEGELLIGDAEAVLAAKSEELDLLLVGSRGYGPMHAVIVGGVAGRLVREAACPVIVLPRGAGHTGADSLFVSAASVRS
jgi:nucleotide-binding universal stress UspA family protein